MGRNVKIRVNYRSDATYMLRLITSIEMDNRFGIETKRDIMRKLREVAAVFMAMPTDVEKTDFAKTAK